MQYVVYTLILSSCLFCQQNGLHFADDIGECIYLNGSFDLLIKMSFKYVPILGQYWYRYAWNNDGSINWYIYGKMDRNELI